MLGTTRNHQGQAGDKGDHAGPQERGQVAGAFEDHKGRHGHDHGDREGDQEDADDETDDTQGRQRHEIRSK